MSPSRRRSSEEDRSGTTPHHHRFMGCVVILVGIGLLYGIVQASASLASFVQGSDATAQTASVGGAQQPMLDQGGLPGVLQRLEATLRTGVEFIRTILVKILEVILAAFAFLSSLVGSAIAWLQALPTRIGGG